MSQFIFDQVYGTEAKKKKIMDNSNFIYYRQMMKIKNNHIKNKSLYQQVYLVPSHLETISTDTPSTVRQIRIPKKQNIMETINQNNYSVQKINSHAFKIFKRKNKNKINSSLNQVRITDWAAQQGYKLNSNRKLYTRTIQSDARRLRNYLTSSQSNSKKSGTRVKNYSVTITDDKTPRTPFKISRNSNYQPTPYSVANSSGFSFRKYQN